MQKCASEVCSSILSSMDLTQASSGGQGFTGSTGRERERRSGSIGRWRESGSGSIGRYRERRDSMTRQVQRERRGSMTRQVEEDWVR